AGGDEDADAQVAQQRGEVRVVDRLRVHESLWPRAIRPPGRNIVRQVNDDHIIRTNRPASPRDTQREPAATEARKTWSPGIDGAGGRGREAEGGIVQPLGVLRTPFRRTASSGGYRGSQE